MPSCSSSDVVHRHDLGPRAENFLNVQRQLRNVPNWLERDGITSEPDESKLAHDAFKVASPAGPDASPGCSAEKICAARRAGDDGLHESTSEGRRRIANSCAPKQCPAPTISEMRRNVIGELRTSAVPSSVKDARNLKSSVPKQCQSCITVASLSQCTNCACGQCRIRDLKITTCLDCV